MGTEIMPYKPGKKKIAAGVTHGFIGETPSKKAPPKVWVEPEWLGEYRLKRDRILFSDVFTCAETKDDILLKYKV